MVAPFLFQHNNTDHIYDTTVYEAHILYKIYYALHSKENIENMNMKINLWLCWQTIYLVWVSKSGSLFLSNNLIPYLDNPPVL